MPHGRYEENNGIKCLVLKEVRLLSGGNFPDSMMIVLLGIKCQNMRHKMMHGLQKLLDIQIS